MNPTDRENLINRIRTLDGLSDHERSALLSLLRENKTYGLVWEDKPEEVEERLRSELPVLIEDKSKAILADVTHSTSTNYPPERKTLTLRHLTTF